MKHDNKDDGAVGRTIHARGAHSAAKDCRQAQNGGPAHSFQRSVNLLPRYTNWCHVIFSSPALNSDNKSIGRLKLEAYSASEEEIGTGFVS
jgi:hypothetical protein